MNKTCYFCCKENCKKCKPFRSSFEYAYVGADLCDNFTPNTDWLEYERLKKENEELKHLIKLMKCTRITS
jgi:hypothetical protein